MSDRAFIKKKMPFSRFWNIKKSGGNTNLDYLKVISRIYQFSCANKVQTFPIQLLQQFRQVAFDC